MHEINLQFFGGRGDDSGLSFTAPSGSTNFISVETPTDLKKALGQKGSSFSVKGALAFTNPDRYMGNCTRCVVAYDFLRRGYNVTALPSYAGDKWTDVSINHVSSADRWRGAYKGAETVRVGAETVTKTVDNIESRMKNFGPGSRAVINVRYADSDISHVFNVENIKGRIYYMDAQVGYKHTKSSMRKFLSGMSLSETSLTRTDNLRISDRAKAFVKSRK